MREKVKFTEGQPVIVKLDFNDGTQCTSRNGEPQFQYTLDNDLRIMYVDPPVRNYILSEGAMAGDVLRIIAHGKDARQWEVEKIVRPVQGAAAFPPAAAAQPPRTTATNREPDNTGYGAGTPARTRRANAQQPTPEQTAALGIGNGNGNGHKPITSGQAEMLSALIQAIDAAAEAERYAHKTTMQIAFDNEDIRTLAITLYIQRMKAGQ